MKLERISFLNFRQYEQEEIIFPNSNFIVLLGANGSGKTTVLDGIAMCLSHVVGRLTSPKDEYNIEYSIESSDIQNGKTNSKVLSKIINENKKINISVSKSVDQRKTTYNFDPKNPFKKIKDDILINQVSSLPLIVYYRANRTFKIKNNTRPISYYAKLLNGYRNSNQLHTSAFSSFENWILKQESIENEKKIELKDFNFNLSTLHPVRIAIEKFMTELNENIYTNFRGKRKSDSNFNYGNFVIGELLINKGEDTIKISQLSSGEKSLISLVADIAVRLTILNTESPESLAGSGLVLIDEIEMHLHPKWQRNLIPALRKVFPNIQFITTTHSPQIISSVSDSDIIILANKSHFSASSNPLGRDSNGILEEIFETVSRPEEVEELISDIFEAINIKKLNEAEIKINSLRYKISKNDPILKRIESILERIKLIES